MKPLAHPAVQALILAATALPSGAEITAEELIAPDFRRSGNQFIFSVAKTTAGRSYQLQSSATMAAGTWRDLESVRAADTGGVEIVSTPDPGQPRSFYRLALAGPNEWRRINQTGPTGGGVAAYDSDRKVTVMFSCEGSYPNDTWEFDGLAWRRISVPGSLPHGRDSSGKMVYDPVKKRMVMQGGWWPDDNDYWTWEYRVTGPGPDERLWVNVVQTTCAYRGAPAMAYDNSRNQVLSFGGNHWQSFYNDTWQMDSTTNTWTHVVDWGPSRFAAGLVYDSGRDKYVMFGGTGRWWSGDTEQGRGNTCEFDPKTKTWTEVFPQGAPGVPGPRWFPSMVYDAAAGVSVLKGGGRNSDGYSYTDTWEWNGTAWTQIPTPAGQPTGGVMWYDSARQKLVLYNAPDTWVYYR